MYVVIYDQMIKIGFYKQESSLIKILEIISKF